jgi:hypothetical protein
MRSAPGIDGFSNKFINKFWNVLKYPFFKCCIECLNTGTLTADSATAQIRIIPKKGDTSKLKNWRPISLLSNFYKILSRAINNILKGVVNRVLSRAQKGFTKSRQIQEVIINIDETIFRCKEKNIKGAMICVDQAKALLTTPTWKKHSGFSTLGKNLSVGLKQLAQTEGLVFFWAMAKSVTFLTY